VVLIDPVCLEIQSCYPRYLLNVVLIPGKQSRHYHSDSLLWISDNPSINLFEQISVSVRYPPTCRRQQIVSPAQILPQTQRPWLCMSSGQLTQASDMNSPVYGHQICDIVGLSTVSIFSISHCILLMQYFVQHIHREIYCLRTNKAGDSVEAWGIPLPGTMSSNRHMGSQQ
jgi:hypothetical protein